MSQHPEHQDSSEVPTCARPCTQNEAILADSFHRRAHLLMVVGNRETCGFSIDVVSTSLLTRQF